MSTQAQLSPGSVGARSSVGARAPAGSSRYVGGVVRPRGRLLRLGEARPDAALHGLGVRHLASGRARHRGALPLGPALVARVSSSRSSSSTESCSSTSHPLPLGSLLGQQAGNMAEVVVGALLLRRLIGPRAAIDRVEQVGGLFAALGGRDGDQRDRGDGVDAGRRSHLGGSEAPTFWRTWWLGDVAGALVVVPLMLAWASDPRRGVAAPADRRGRPADRRRRDARRARRVHRRARHLRGLPGADLGGVPVRHVRAPRCRSRSRRAWRSASPPTTSGRSSSSRSTTGP